MGLRILLATVLCAASVISACGGQTPKKPDSFPATPPPDPTPLKLPETQKSEATERPIDLGGPCLPRGAHPLLTLTGKLEEQLRSNGDWESLIAAAKQDVRSDCSIPYRWDHASVHDFGGTCGDYLLAKISKVFPELGREVL